MMTREPGKMKDFELTDMYFKKLEETIRRAPEYWLWSHKRWSRTREEFDRLYEVVDGKVMPKSQKSN
jgi:KDO2-lipid IV(A) lauroyltransferase